MQKIIVFPAEGFTHIRCDGPNCGECFPFDKMARCLRCRQTTYCSDKCQDDHFHAGHNNVCSQQPGDKRKGSELNYADTGQYSQGNPGNLFVASPSLGNGPCLATADTPVKMMRALEMYWPVDSTVKSGEAPYYNMKYGKAPYPYVASVMERVLPEQPMESPFADAMSPADQHGTACHWSNWTWRDAQGNVLIDACSIPPHVKDHIREGLRAKKLCWEYLYESGFMSLIGEAHTPAEAVENALKVMIHAENKPNPGKTLEVFRHIWWKVRLTPFNPNFNRNLYFIMKKKGMHLGRFGGTAWNDDEIRAVCHSPTSLHPFACGCYSCSLRNLPDATKEARRRFDWNESIDHINSTHGGLMCMSYQTYTELKSGKYDDDDELWKYVQDCHKFRVDVIAHDKTSKQLQNSVKRGGQPEKIALKLIEKLGPPPEVPVMERDKFVNNNVSRVDEDRVIAMLDVCGEENRLPSHCEWDAILAIIRDSNKDSNSSSTGTSSSDSNGALKKNKGTSSATSAGGKVGVSKSGGKARGKDNSSSSSKKASRGRGTLADSSLDHSTSRPSRNAVTKVSYYESESNTDESAGEESDAYRDSDSEGGSDSDDSDGSDGIDTSSDSDAEEDDNFGGGRSSRKRAPKSRKASATVTGYQKQHSWTDEEREGLAEEYRARVKNGKKLPNGAVDDLIEAMIVRFPLLKGVTRDSFRGAIETVSTGRGRAASRAWTPLDIAALEEAVTEADEALSGRKRPHGFWTTIGKKLKRTPDECNQRYRDLQMKKKAATLKRTPLTEEDKQTIRSRVGQLRCFGMLSMIAREMGRPPQQIRDFFNDHPEYFADLDLADGPTEAAAVVDAEDGDSIDKG